MRPVVLVCVLSLFATTRTTVNLRSGDETVAELEAQYAQLLRRRAEKDFPDRSPMEISSERAEEDYFRKQLTQIPVSQLTTEKARLAYGIMKEDLESRLAVRICRRELWDISQTEGWQVGLAGLASNEAVATAADRQSALRNWQAAPKFIDTEIANLREGIAKGYTVPATIVGRVLRQVNAIIADPILLDSTAARSSDPDFAAKFRKLIASEILPALKRYRDFLAHDYAPHARTTLGISALPNGSACYAAYLRRYSTLQITPEEVYRRGEETVNQSTNEIKRLGEKLFATSDLHKIIVRSHSAKANRFQSKKELLGYAQRELERARSESAALFENLPTQPVVIKPLPAYQKNSGVSSHYEPQSDPSKPAVFWISLDDWKDETRASVEITVVHETFPGHHAQSVIARRDAPRSPIYGFIPNAAYVEGWANYAEQLAEDVGIVGDGYERIQRRVIFGRSLVLDSGVNVLGWSREQAERYAMETGLSRQTADDVIDRAVVEPGQLTSYELGGLEIRKLREQERHRLGSTFDLKTFHQEILDHGVVPLDTLRQLIEPPSYGSK